MMKEKNIKYEELSKKALTALKRQAKHYDRQEKYKTLLEEAMEDCRNSNTEFLRVLVAEGIITVEESKQYYNWTNYRVAKEIKFCGIGEEVKVDV
jgi:BioD-like phosphotransacetylase family protein